ncbi:hypothetical protein [Xanthomonas sp. 1678]|uniref:hypothetical protein n=1 Tax=Xanthomonas sp. 1678 TaxID=3158788 RepID=UPI00285B2729|nr:hypothetical protein [Xanthomonas translucens]
MKTALFLLLAASTPASALAASVSGTLVAGGGIDDMRIVVRAADGRNVEAYCAARCGDWFVAAPESDMFVLKKAVEGKRVALDYASEANGERIAGPGPDDRLLFVKRVRLLP